MGSGDDADGQLLLWQGLPGTGKTATMKALVALARAQKRSVRLCAPTGKAARRLAEKIADLVKDKRIDGISDLRDESDRDGLRIVIDLNGPIPLDQYPALTAAIAPLRRRDVE